MTNWLRRCGTWRSGRGLEPQFEVDEPLAEGVDCQSQLCKCDDTEQGLDIILRKAYIDNGVIAVDRDDAHSYLIFDQSAVSGAKRPFAPGNDTEVAEHGSGQECVAGAGVHKRLDLRSLALVEVGNLNCNV